MEKDQFSRTQASSTLGEVGAVDRVGYDPRTETYHSQHDWAGDDPLSLTVINTLAVAAGTDPGSIAPLYSAIDLDALDALFSARDTTDIEVEFVYGEWSVRVTSGGEVVVRSDG